MTKKSGSSPLARGLRFIFRFLSDGWGIIPARAGFTAHPPRSSIADPDHPRSRGVYSWLPLPAGAGPGSSPLARGLPVLRRVLDRLPGIIPARAGFTRRGRWWTSDRGDHPRSRGVYLAMSTPSSGPAGSSPLARGLRSRLEQDRRPGRIIPARAGFTPADS